MESEDSLGQLRTGQDKPLVMSSSSIPLMRRKRQPETVARILLGRKKPSSSLNSHGSCEVQRFVGPPFNQINQVGRAATAGAARG